MKEIYLKMLDLLAFMPQPNTAKELEVYNQLQKIRWIDMDKGQLEFYDTRPAVAFPCALIKIEVARTENLGNNVQRCYGRGIVRLAFDYVGETAAKTPQALRAQSLAYFELVEAVYLAVQGKPAGLAKFDRQSATEENRPDGLKVLNIPFSTIWLDKSAERL